MAHAQAAPDAAGPARVLRPPACPLFVFWNTRHAGRRARRAGGSATRATLGLDAIFPAVFLALLAPQLRRPGRR